MSVTAATGFSVGTAATGLRASGGDDVVVLLSDTQAVATGVFTSNQMAAAPITQSKEALRDGTLRAVVVSAGNANACTGPPGLRDANEMAARAASVLGVQPSDVAVASTGVIGVPLEMAPLDAAIERAAASLGDDGTAAAEAIMTTDTFSKEACASVTVGAAEYSVGGMAKGAGMIRPDMATTLAFITTDAPLTEPACRQALGEATAASFNRITVDGETSTNDCMLLLANGAAGGDPIGPDSPGYAAIADAVSQVAGSLARQVVRDGEGATTFIEITVTGALDDEQAHAAAMAVADSLLFKCAVFGNDANWGRVVSAVGASRAKVDPECISVSFAGTLVAQAGTAVPFDEEHVTAALAAEEVDVVVDLGIGDGTATVWTCDLSYDYVKINADYRS